jgi:hypothetical protein
MIPLRNGTRDGSSAAKHPPNESAFSFLHRRRVTGFASLDDADCILRPTVRLIQLAGLGIAERDPVADCVTIWQRDRRDTLSPFSG